MSDMRILFKYDDKSFLLQPYTTSQEKDILISENFIDDYDELLDSTLNICGIDKNDVSDLSQFEKIAILYKIRSISVGETIPIKYKCKHCNQPNETEIEIVDIIKESRIKNKNIKNAYCEISFENMHLFVENIDIEELDFDEYEKLFNEIQKSVTTFDFIKEHQCLKCKKTNKLDIRKNVVSNMSEDSLTSIYQCYNDLIQFGNYSKIDIDSMLPFERSIFIGLLNKTKEDLK